MKTSASPVTVLLLLLWMNGATHAAQEIPSVDSRGEEMRREESVSAYGKLPLSFEENQGQTDPTVKFLSRGKGYTLYLTQTEAVLTLKPGVENTLKPVKGKAPTPVSFAPPSTLRMQLLGANPKAAISGADLLPGKSNYFIGSDRSKWKSDLPIYGKVKYENVYPGIGLVYYGNQRQLEYDFVVAPKGDPNRIELAFKGADTLRLDENGDLILSIKQGELRFHKPVIYQEENGDRKMIPGAYISKGKNRIGFQVARYDRSRPLIIDPTLGYSTYLGGSGNVNCGCDEGKGIAVDSSGNSYLVGMTDSNNFPTANPIQPALAGITDVFIAKLNSAGNALLYSTYLGGNSSSTGTALAIDAMGNVYVTGYAGSDFPTTPGSFQPTAPDNTYSHAFVAKLNPNGNGLIYSTFITGNGDDRGSGIAVDASGNAYVAGSTGSTAFPTKNPIQASMTDPCDGNITNSCSDAFVTKLNAAGSALIYSTYLGGSEGDIAFGIAVDPSGNAYVTGFTESGNFPVTPGAFQTVNHRGQDSRHDGDAFVTKINSAGALFYSTYLGGNGDESTFGIAADSDGNAYVTGWTHSSDFPVTSGAFQTTRNGYSDAFVTKLNAGGTALIYSTYLGGSLNEIANGIAVDRSGNVYVTGNTTSTDFPTMFPTQGSIAPGDFGDAFVAKLNPSLANLIYSTYLGGNDYDVGNGIAIDPFGDIYVTGLTGSTNFPTTPGAVQPSYHGNRDAFVAKIAVTQSYSDPFNRANSTSLGSNWNETLGNLELFNGAVRNTTTNNKAAVYTRALGPDQAVSADCKVTEAGSSCGVMARWSDDNNYYRARVDVGAQNIALFKTVNGITTRLGVSSRPLALNTFYRVQLVVRGSEIWAYFANESTPAISVMDRSLPTGNLVGIRSYAASVYATVFENFDVTTPFADTFNRANSSNLGATWDEYLPDLEIFEGEVRNGSGANQPKAARYITSVGPDQEIAVDCKVTAAGNACGLMGRWADANNYYLLRLDAGAQNVALFKVVNGATTRIGQISRPLKFNSYYRLRLVAKGNRLTAFFGNESAAAMSVVDSALTAGSFAGIRAFASGADTTFFNNFDLTVAQ